MAEFDEKYCLDMFKQLVDIDSTTGQFEKIQGKICEISRDIGYD